jgi:hypothetical protein
MPRVRGLGAVLAAAAVVDHQHPAAVRRGRRIGVQQLQPAGVDPPTTNTTITRMSGK